ncbi:MAG: S-layer homology domain-containing protein [Clostridia bacterium]|nr:S-layer homology domain-containing protein [Clostridia bacterium]
MKKILSFLITAMMLLSIASCHISALSDYEVEVLSALSIMEGDPSGNMRYSDKVSRAECAKIVVASSTYRNMVEMDKKSSPFLDVTYQHWAAPYVTTGIKYGLFKGYMDATFRPSNTVLLEEALVMFLRILGYTDEDMGNDWPYSQIETARKAGLLNNLSKSAGQELNRYDIATIAFNALSSNPKNSDKTLMSNFNTTIGPKTVTSSTWYQDFDADSSLTIIKDGERASLSDVKINDIVYYMEEYATALVYSKKITGIYEDAQPNKNLPSSVTVSGVTYNLEGTNALSKLSSGGKFNYGDSITLLMGKSGGIADIVDSSASAQLGEKIYGFLTAAGTKESTVSGTKVIKPYVRIILTSGETLEYITEKNYDSLVNQVVAVKLNNSIATLTRMNTSYDISGTFTWGSGTNKLGSYQLADDAKIIETSTVEENETAIVTSVYPQRLNGIKIANRDVLYVSKNSVGNIDGLILNDVTGDGYTYGIMTKVSNTNSDRSLSGSYEYLSDGITTTFSTQNKIFNVSYGQAVQIATDGREISSLVSLSSISGKKISNISGSVITIDGKDYILWDKVQIYVKKQLSAQSSYTMITMDELVEMADEYNVSAFTDRPMSSGGRIRIIVLS